MKKILMSMIFLVWLTPAMAEEVSINSGDTVKISVYNNPDLTTETRVSSKGTITFPLIDEVDIAGLSPRAAERRISSRLVREGYLKAAQVNVVVLDSKSQQISVLGRVNVPGKYSIDASAQTVVDFLSLAGGITVDASNKVILIKRGSDKPKRITVDVDELFKNGDLAQLKSADLQLEPGDIIYVPLQPMFYVYGEVQRPGAYPLRNGMTVAQAISLGGGITTRGTENGLTIKRKNEDGKLRELDAKDSSLVQENDVVYVDESMF